MTPKLSNLDIPEIKAATAEWALVSSQIEKITLHRFKPPKIQNPEGPFYAIIIWVSPEVDVTITPWEELVNAPDGKAPRAQVREQYKGQDGNIDTEKIEKHPLYDLWKLFDNLSDPIGRGYFDSFYRDGFERSDPRFDWIVLLLNIGAESLFEQGEEHDDLDSTEVGSVVLFSRKAIPPQNDGTKTQPSMSVESNAPETDYNNRSIFPRINLEQLRRYAKRWVEKFPDVPIENITLYGYSSPYPEKTHKQHPGKYCIVFDITGEVLPDPETADSHIDKIESFNRSIYDIIEYYQTIRNQDSYLSLMDAAFPSSVYHDKPSENFKDEWMFLTGRLAEGNRGIMIKESCWVLYGVMDQTEIQQQMPGLPERDPAQQERSPENVFIHEDDFWKISFSGMCLKPIKHLDGIVYIAHLIKNKTFHVSDLYETAHPKSSDQHIISDEEMKKALAAEEMSVSNMNLPKLDLTSKEDYKKYIQERRDIIGDPDLPGAERKKAEEEINLLITTLQKEYGRNPLSLEKTVRQSEIIKGDSDKVRNSIKLAIKTIRSHSIELADYLRCNIKSGTTYQFIGDPDIWKIVT